MTLPIIHKTLMVSETQVDQRLDNFLITRLKGLPKSCLYRLLRQKKIRVNKRRSQPSYRIQAGDIIAIPNLHLKETLSNPFTLSQTLKAQLLHSILFEDNQLLVINKPAGLAVHGGSGIRLGLIEALRQIKPELKLLELAHRLDRETSGCLLLAKKAACLKQLHALFREGTIKKTYFALVEGHWPAQLREVSVALKKNQLLSGERMVKVDAAGKPAYTRFRVLEYFAHNNSSLLEIQLDTGRTHQIRVHTQHVHHPIAGDEKYGHTAFNQKMRALGLKRLFLHAAQLRFRLAASGQYFDIKAPLPSNLEVILHNMRLLENEGI